MTELQFLCRIRQTAIYAVLCMLLYFLVSFLPTMIVVMAESQFVNSRIINGNPVEDIAKSSTFYAKAARRNDELAKEKKIPYSLCGATIIHSDILITAAHCQGAFNYGVLVYDEKTNDYTRKIQIDRQIRHPKWDYNNPSEPGNLNYDILILRLEIPLQPDEDFIQSININTRSSYPEEDDLLYIYGYGVTETGGVSKELRTATVQYISNENCTRSLIEHTNTYISLLPNEFLCTTGVETILDEEDSESTLLTSTCRGDSGGPLVGQIATDDTNEQVLVGIISSGINCSTEEIPNGYARISAATHWIQEQICILSRDTPTSCQPTTTEEKGTTSIEIILYIQYDDFPEDITFVIRSKRNDSIVYSGPTNVPRGNTTSNSTIYLEPGEYTFDIYDRRGNGMQRGWWNLISSNETNEEIKLAYGNGDFRTYQITEFVIDSSVPPITFDSKGTIDNDLINDEFDEGDTIDSIGQLEKCIFAKSQEEAYANENKDFIYCECVHSGNDTDKDVVEIQCFNSKNVSCNIQYAVCETSNDCCSNRQCSNGYCTPSITKSSSGARKDDSRLGTSSIRRPGDRRRYQRRGR